MEFCWRGSVEGGVAFEMQENLVLEPSVRVLYNLINYDNMSDKYGKTARFDDVQNLELEAGVKIEKTWFTDNNSVVKLFVKPAVIQNFGSGDVSITSLETIQGVYDEFLVRGDVGGSVGLENGFNLFGNLGYIKGKDYEATEFNFGVMYKC